ncbi:hypothetical protein JOB18_046627 [Solea senegalensis]|uniref:Uncharacterized protein n=1 Tax=Solea senegalensis TaxID=28829 RepID=A0AAV6PPQ9_SOLSE|nr:hypothetical protein JOB18_046627 [Solea senegalensis]
MSPAKNAKELLVYSSPTRPGVKCRVSVSHFTFFVYNWVSILCGVIVIAHAKQQLLFKFKFEWTLMDWETALYLLTSVNSFVLRQHTCDVYVIADGTTLITDRAKILERWVEHFEAVLNRPSTIKTEAIQRLPQIPVNQELDALPSTCETQKAISQMTSGKAPCLDGIPAEVYKSARADAVTSPLGEDIYSPRTDIFQSMWEKAMLTDTIQDSDERICTRYRTDGKLLNKWRLLALTKVKQTVIKDFLFCTLNAASEQKMQSLTDRFSGSCDNFGLTNSTKKTKVMFQPCPGKPYKEPMYHCTWPSLEHGGQFHIPRQHLVTSDTSRK